MNLWGFSEMMMQPAQHVCHAGCLPRKGLNSAWIIYNLRDTYRADCIVTSENLQELVTRSVSSSDKLMQELNFTNADTIRLKLEVKLADLILRPYGANMLRKTTNTEVPNYWLMSSNKG